MQTFDIDEAAGFLKMRPSVLRRKAAEGIIPGAKAGKRWCFIDIDLADYLRSRYSNKQPMELRISNLEGKKSCLSPKEMKSIGLDFLSKEKEYSNLLGLKTEQKQKG